DSSVHYAVNRTGTVFTTSKERQVDSLYNTYKYPGLPLGPISNPGLLAIKAALYPSPNNYWYFLSDEEGKIHYARTLEEHNLNKAKYLR
ncbi:MAG: endolytic transglycosylase MltG, partial [Patescibacteria group bacterium]